MAIAVTIGSTDHFRAEAEVNFGAKSIHVAFSGELDERAKLLEVMNYIAGLDHDVTQLVVSTEKLHRINSSGVREWLLFLKNLPKRYSLSFSHLGESFIAHANIYPVMLGNPRGFIRTIELPYFCETCNTRKTNAVKVEELKRTDDSLLPPEWKCPTCGGPTEFDELLPGYFSFLRTQFGFPSPTHGGGDNS